jgi:hypothetical protein
VLAGTGVIQMITNIAAKSCSVVKIVFYLYLEGNVDKIQDDGTMLE